MNWRAIVFSASLVSYSWMSSVHAEQIRLNPIKDNTLFQNGDFSNGMGSYIFAGTNGGGSARRGLLAFDVATNLPPDANVTEVRLTLNMSRTRSGTQSVRLHRLLQDWGESMTDALGHEGGGIEAGAGDATWTLAVSPDVKWDEPGGDFVSDASAETSVGDIGIYTWNSTKMLIADVQSWLDDPSTNFGWILLGNESTNETAKRFGSRDSTDDIQRPVLQVDFELSGGLVGDFNSNGVLDVDDIDALTGEVRSGTNSPSFDLNGDHMVDQEDRRIWVEEIVQTYFGDSNLDGEFNSADIVVVFQAGEYEDQLASNARWSTGDWNGDAEFGTSDLVFGFRAGGFEQGPRGSMNLVPESTSFLMAAAALFGIGVLQRSLLADFRDLQ